MHMVQWFFCCFGALVFIAGFVWLVAVCLTGSMGGSVVAAPVGAPSELGHIVVGGGGKVMRLNVRSALPVVVLGCEVVLTCGVFVLFPDL